MKTKALLVSFALAFGLSLLLFGLLGGDSALAVATSRSRDASASGPSYLAISPTVKVGACLSVYTVTNQGGASASMMHSFFDAKDQLLYTFADTIVTGTSRTYDLADIGVLAEGYEGYVVVSADQPITFTLQICPARPFPCQARPNDGFMIYTSVQVAVDAASAGDTIKVAGYCSEVSARAGVTQVVYISKTVTIQGGYTFTNWTTPDPARNPTTLDAQKLGRVLYITGDISPVVEGLHITGGLAGDQGGAPDYWADVGGGVYIVSATVTLRDNQVYGNVGTDCGGGVYLVNSDTAINNNVIASNLAIQGGGLCLLDSDATLDGNTIIGNQAWHGGGLYLGNDDVENEITATLSNNRVLSNTAVGCGGGFYLRNSANTLVNNVFVGNRADEVGGGGLCLLDSSSLLLHTTIAHNDGGAGSGVHISDLSSTLQRSTIWMTNTILVSHTVGISVTSGNTVTVNGVLWHQTPITTSAGTTASVSVKGQRTGDPAFAADGYHLTIGSAAIDAGVDAGVLIDVDGDRRPVGRPDLGADEWAVRVYLPLVLRRFP
jgi:parallel beta-helix repeat protein